MDNRSNKQYNQAAHSRKLSKEETCNQSEVDFTIDSSSNIKEPRIKNFIEIEKEPRIKNFIHIEDPNVIIHEEEDQKNLFKESWRESSKVAESNKESEKRRDNRDTFKIQKRGIESKEKKVKDYDLRSKVKVQQISSYNKQKLESKEQLKLKTCITGKEKDGQNVSRISN